MSDYGVSFSNGFAIHDSWNVEQKSEHPISWNVEQKSEHSICQLVKPTLRALQYIHKRRTKSPPTFVYF